MHFIASVFLMCALQSSPSATHMDRHAPGGEGEQFSALPQRSPLHHRLMRKSCFITTAKGRYYYACKTGKPQKRKK